MLTLPPSLEVHEDPERASVLLGKARQWLEKEERTDGIHASDIRAPRKAFWRFLDPKPLSDREIGLFLVGRILHSFVLGALENSIDLNRSDEGSQYSEDLGIFTSQDKNLEGKPAELKTSRAMYPAKNVGDLGTYLRQLLIYMAKEKSTEGLLWVLYTNAKDETGATSPQFKCFRVTISDEELAALAIEIRAIRDQIVDAIKNKVHTSLPLCEEWECSDTKCPWWSKCQPENRYGNPEYGKRKR